MKIIKHISFLIYFLIISVNAEPTIIKISDISLAEYLNSRNRLGLRRIDVLKTVAQSIATQWPDKKVDFSNNNAGRILNSFLKSIKKDSKETDQKVSICLDKKTDGNTCRNRFVYTPKEKSSYFLTNPEKVELVASFLHLIERLNTYKFIVNDDHEIGSTIKESCSITEINFNEIFSLVPLKASHQKTREF